jgi:hypothetical protein
MTGPEIIPLFQSYGRFHTFFQFIQVFVCMVSESHKNCSDTIGLPALRKYLLISFAVFFPCNFPAMHGSYNFWTKKLTILFAGKFWCFCRMVYMPMGYIYGNKFVGPITPTILALREELYNIPYGEIHWNTARSSCAMVC